VAVGNDLQPWYGLFRVSLYFPWVVHMSDTPSEDDFEGASLWNGIAKDICPLVKGGVAFADRVSRPKFSVVCPSLIDQVDEQEQ